MNIRLDRNVTPTGPWALYIEDIRPPVLIPAGKFSPVAKRNAAKYLAEHHGLNVASASRP